MIDAKTVGSPGWWMVRLGRQLQWEKLRLDRLEQYYTGRQPIQWSKNMSGSTMYEVHRMCRSNFAATIVDAPCERMAIRSVVTGAEASDDDGDAEAWAKLIADDVDTTINVAVRMAKKFGRAYLATSYPDASTDGVAPITAEDPRQTITEADPVNPRKTRAALKLFHDSAAGLDVAVLWLPGQTWVATRERKTSPLKPRSQWLLGSPEPVPVVFSAGAYTMQPVRPAGGGDPDAFYSEEYPQQDIPIEVIENPGGVGEFELHTDLLDRINHGILQRVVIATIQAFKQRAIITAAGAEVPPLQTTDDQGNPIDLDSLFSSDPGALWMMPQGRTLWESGQVDLTGILSSVKDDVLHLSAVTGTPMHMFTPDAASNSAEGAQLMRERLVFKVEDFERIAGRALGRAIARKFRFEGDAARGDVSKVRVSWMPAERFSLAEKGMAASQVGDTMTWEQTQREIWQQSPAQISEAAGQRMQDLQVQAIAAAVTKPPTPPTTPPARPAVTSDESTTNPASAA